MPSSYALAPGQWVVCTPPSKLTKRASLSLRSSLQLNHAQGCCHTWATHNLERV